MSKGFRLEGDLRIGLDKLDQHVQRAMVAAANFTAPQIEQYMRANASWTDRTGAARSGLRAQVQTSPNKVAIIMFHSVPYGVWLEVRWGGKYAILEPALAWGGPVFVATIARLAFD